MRALKIALVLGLLSASPKVFACNFDTECGPGSTCVKSGFSLTGVCTRSMGDNPNNKLKMDRIQKKLDYGDAWGAQREMKDTRGNSCSFNTECGVGGKCLKTGSDLYGVCTK